uniref:Protein slowmo n=1 Tax=Cacopsylla melanoneura TaxID=428564 RepID=A0A8D8SUF6_9HEMI
MKIWTSEHTFDHPWETIVQATWRKYPNPMNTAVKGIDVIDRKVENGILKSHRLLSSQWGLPNWARSVVGSTNIFYASERSEIDPKRREMTLETNNLTYGHVIAVDERLVYQPHPEDNSKTLLKQEAVVTVRGIPLSSYVENLLTSKISHNAGKGRLAIEWVINKLDSEVQDLKSSTDEILNHTKKSIDDITRHHNSDFSNPA